MRYLVYFSSPLKRVQSEGTLLKVRFLFLWCCCCFVLFISLCLVAHCKKIVLIVCNIFKCVKDSVLFIVFIHYTFQPRVIFEKVKQCLNSQRQAYHVLACHLVVVDGIISTGRLNPAISTIQPVRARPKYLDNNDWVPFRWKKECGNWLGKVTPPFITRYKYLCYVNKEHKKELSH